MVGIHRLWRARSTSSRRPFHSAPLRSAMACRHQPTSIRMPHHGHTSDISNKKKFLQNGCLFCWLAPQEMQKRQEGPLTPPTRLIHLGAVQYALPTWVPRYSWATKHGSHVAELHKRTEGCGMIGAHVIHIPIICHDDEAKASRLSGGGILDDTGLLHRPIHIKLALQLLSDGSTTKLTRRRCHRNCLLTLCQKP